MAQKVQVILLDDLDGGEADETINFGLDGSTYEIDLSKKNAAKLRDVLAPYVASARRAGTKRARGKARAGGARGGATDTAAVRDWARSQGLKVSDRGRIPAEILEKYEASR
ncbi:histone-like nucleoid-structuring protein Lsr2 [Phytoactinopolyspora limicola]|uniref:histone-like nucleoid-structuring protein Lsr2 n=1 Tax=Phytoactinopolyspora limicola TaxID=2715536 RepID=UPI0014092FE9|nr:Lsr2 family protein [Phytoactinopolyspora limicola]